MMLQTFVPWREDTNLGLAFNETMAALPEDGWAVLLDHDVMFTTYEWNRQIQAAIKAEPEGTFTGITNRIGCKWQQAGVDMRNHDILFHRTVGYERLKNRWLTDVTDSVGWGGFVMVVSKKVWRAVGGFVDGMLCCDHMFHFTLRNKGFKAYQIEGLYLYHYKQGGSEKYAPKTLYAKCECRTRRDYAEPKRVKLIEFMPSETTLKFPPSPKMLQMSQAAQRSAAAPKETRPMSKATRARLGLK